MFVGDLPEGCGAYELQQLFSELAHVVNISMIERKGIAFITVESEAEVGHIIDVADSAGLHIHGQMIRVARAHKPSDGPVRLRSTLQIALLHTCRMCVLCQWRMLPGCRKPLFVRARKLSSPPAAHKPFYWRSHSKTLHVLTCSSSTLLSPRVLSGRATCMPFW